MTRLENIDPGEFEQVLMVSGQTFWMVALDGTICDVFGALESGLGYSADELRGSPLRDIIDPADLPKATAEFDSVARAKLKDSNFEIELKVIGKCGDLFDVKVNGRVTVRQGMDPVVVGLTTDITRQRLAERTLEQERLRLFRTFENAPNGIILLHIDEERGGLIKRANAEACRIAGRIEDELVGQWLIDGNLTDLVDAEVDEAFAQSKAMFEEGSGSFRIQRVLKRPDGSRIHISAAVSALAGEGWEVMTEERPVNAIVHIEDITDQRQEADELTHQAQHDSLTDLINRRHFISLLEDRLERSWSGRGGGALMMIDLDAFKVVNDSHGHIAGDGVLRDVARILKAELRDTDPVARLGGDEFAVLLPKIDRDGAAEVAESLLDVFRKARIEIAESQGEDFLPSVSIGVIMLDRRGVNPEAALRDCDKAMYEAKRLGGGRVVVDDGPPPDRSG